MIKDCRKENIQKQRSHGVIGDQRVGHQKEQQPEKQSGEDRIVAKGVTQTRFLVRMAHRLKRLLRQSFQVYDVHKPLRKKPGPVRNLHQCSRARRCCERGLIEIC